MIRTILCSALFVLPVYAQATVNCSGTVELPGSSITGNCPVAGFCSADVTPAYGSGTLYCDQGVTVTVEVNASPGFANLTCQSGFLSGNVSGGSASISGSCSDGSTFNGNGTYNPGFVDGSCQMGGFLNATLSGGNVSISGSCGEL